MKNELPNFSIQFFLELKDRYNIFVSEETTTEQPIDENIYRDNEAVVHNVESLADYDEQVKNAGDKIVLVEFHATWSELCTYIAPYIDHFAQKYGLRVVVLKVDVDVQKKLAQKYKLHWWYYQVTNMPTLVFLKNGKNVLRFSSADPAKIENAINTLIK